MPTSNQIVIKMELRVKSEDFENKTRICSMRHSLLFLLLMALLPIGIASEAYATNKARAECVSTVYATYYPLGYDPALGKYLSDTERNGLAPAVEISIGFRSLCNYLVSDLKLQQFKFTLKIKGYRNGIEIPLLKSVDFLPLGASLSFSVPGIAPGDYTANLLVQDISTPNSGRREIDLNQFIAVYSLTPSPTPTARKTTSSFRSLYNSETVWVVGSSAKVYACWSARVRSLKLQVKVRGKWISKTSAKFSKNPTLCSGKFPWVAKYSWPVDEYGDVPRKGSRGRNLMVRQYASGLKNMSSVSRIVYASNSDRIQDGLDVIEDELDLSLR